MEQVLNGILGRIEKIHETTIPLLMPLMDAAVPEKQRLERLLQRDFMQA